MGIRILRHKTRRNKMHAQATRQCDIFWEQSSRTKIQFSHENISLQLIWFQLWCSSTQPSLLISPFSSSGVQSSPETISKWCYWTAAMDYQPHSKCFNFLQCVFEGAKEAKYSMWLLHYYIHVGRRFNMQELGNLCQSHLKRNTPISALNEATFLCRMKRHVAHRYFGEMNCLHVIGSRTKLVPC
jgi:hypothetical protein